MPARCYGVRSNLSGQTAAHLAFEHHTGRWLGGFGSNFFRSWVFPLYTPSGLTVVREFAYDHPFHNGVFVGQNPVRMNGRIGNFWALPVPRSPDDHIMTQIGRMDAQDGPQVEIGPTGVRFTLPSVWRDEHEIPLLDEERVVWLWATSDATLCEVTSRKMAAYGPLEFSQTKFGSIGMRVEERLLPDLGGEIIGVLDGELRRGRADEVANAMACDVVAYEGVRRQGDRWGVAMMVGDNSASPQRRGPWFIRDYGMAMFNATMQSAIALAEGQTWNTALRVIAYDGALTAERVAEWNQLWQEPHADG